jgi:hypothetical protein
VRLHSTAGFVILACAVIVVAAGQPPAQRTAPPSQKEGPADTAEEQDTRKDCLGCHGPFSKIVEATADYVAPSGEKTSPHKYIPHNSDIEDEIAECSHCHVVHPVDPPPAKGSIDLSKVTVQWCYKACHHQKNFNSCKKCHI